VTPQAGYYDRLHELLVRCEHARRRAQAALDAAQVAMQRAADRRAVSQARRGLLVPVTSSATDAVTAEQALIDAEVEQSAIDGEVAHSRDEILQPGGTSPRQQ
jgi:hypothetical protein